MNVEYHDTALGEEVANRARRFIDEEVLPAERALAAGETADDELIEELKAKARNRDVFAPQMPEEFGGLGLDLRDALPLYEQSGRSFLSQPAMRVAAPDEGTMYLLDMLATRSQQEEYLRPLVDGEIKSAFAMTEPLQGGGADPTMVKTTAEKDGDEWVVNGHKWWITNGSEAEFIVLMAQTDPDVHPYEGCSMLIVPADTPGIEIVRDLPHMGETTLGTVHSEILFDDVRVPEENLLGTEGDGFSHAQQRMVPARLTQCMRHAGGARRALDVAKAFMSERDVFGDRLAKKQAPRFEIAEAETKLHTARLTARHAAKSVASGNDGTTEAAMTKYYTTTVVQEIIDTAMQFTGSNGIGKDLPLSELFEGARIIRIADGPDEVQKRVIARDAFETVDESEVEHISRFMRPRRP